MFKAVDVFNKMTLKEKIGQMYMQYYQGYDDMPEKFKEMNRKNQLGGFIFFSGNNVRNLTQLRSMTEKIQSYAGENDYNLPFLLTIDQEGGQLTAIFNETTIFPGNMTLGFANDKELAYKQGKHVAKELKYAGINLCYAPVLDVDYDALNGVPVVDNRRFSTKPQVVADMGSAFIKGMEDEGILACGKHFPGMRITEVDTHFQVDRSPYDMERLEEVEIYPFKQAIGEGLSCIMTHHGIFDAIDKDLPASLSPKTTEYLREKLGFKGLIITDDLLMKAILSEYGERDSIKLAIKAGADLIISSCADDWFVDFVYELVQTGELSEERINDAALRILNYKEQIFVKDQKEAQNEEYVGELKDLENGVEVTTRKMTLKEKGDALSREIAEKGIILYKGEQSQLPLAIENKKVGVIFGNPARLVMSDATNLYDISLKETIRKITGHQDIKEAIMPWHPTDEEIISVADVGIISDVIVFTTVNAYKFTRQIDVLKEIRKFCPTKTIVAIASRSPMDAEILAQYADFVIVTGGITESIFEAVCENVFEGKPFTHNEAKELEYVKNSRVES
jgi:beta-N-acetylhexosaminidase